MINTGKCPYCKKVVRKAKMEDVEICIGFESIRRGLSYQCTSCNSVLSVQMNPFDLNDELKDEILEELRKIIN